jgi:hypothetical protein
MFCRRLPSLLLPLDVHHLKFKREIVLSSTAELNLVLHPSLATTQPISSSSELLSPVPFPLSSQVAQDVLDVPLQLSLSIHFHNLHVITPPASLILRRGR